MTAAALDKPLLPDEETNAPSWVAAVLRVPLLGKLLGANLVLVVGAVIAHYAFPDASMVAQLGVLLVFSFAATSLLAWLALRPIAQLELTAERVSAGDFRARAPSSPIADRDIARLGSTLNRLLDRVEADRGRIQYLAGRSVRARDLERESVARELRDSLAQTLAAIALNIAAARGSNEDPAVETCLQNTRDLIQQLSDEMRSVAETLYPGTLEEFGLLNAIEALARRVSRRSRLRVEVAGERFNAPLPARTASALYRVADEALRNVEQHAQADHVRITLRSNGHVWLDIEDDGRGVDLKLTDPLQAGLGLFSARTVLALVGGELQISSEPGLGTRVAAHVPMPPPTRHQ
jgi:signal transduction histidine kinase